jgi:hypothetical protein
MAVSRKGTPTSQTVASGFSNVLTLPSGLAAGDCMILRVGFGSGASIPVLSTPSGWTALDSQNDGSGSSAFTQATFYRVFVAGDTTVTASFDRTCFSDVDVSAYTGNDTVTPIGAGEHSSNASVSAGTTATGTGVTASTNGSYLVYLESDGTGRTSGPAGMSNRLTYDTDIYTDDVAINAGATGNKTSNLGTSQTWIVQMVVIKPAATSVSTDQVPLAAALSAPAVKAPRRQSVDTSAPIGTGTFALPGAVHIHQPQSQPRAWSARRPAPEVVVPVGALMVAAGLSSLGWGPVTAQAAPGVQRPPPPAPSAPIGTGTFALTKFPSGLFAQQNGTVEPQQRQAPASVEPVGTLLTPSASLGWLYYDTTAPSVRRLIITASAGDEPRPLQQAALSSLGWASIESQRGAKQSAGRSQPEQPTSPLAPFVSLSTGWLRADLPFDAPLLPPKVSDSSPVGTPLAGSLTSLGWLAPLVAPSVVAPPRAQEAQQPPGPLTPFISPSTGWMGYVAVPFDAPLVPPRVTDSSPVGLLLTPQPFGWNAQPQDRPAPIIPRRVEPSAPVGTPFAIALPSNGWLATDNPRTPLKLGRSAPTDPVGSLLVLPPLPSLAWLATDSPRTPYVTHRDPPNDPVGAAFPFLAKLGPYWYADIPPKAPPPGPRPQSAEPVGAAFAAVLLSSGWFPLPDSPRAASRAQRQQPTDPLAALQFGGAPWADITTSPTRLVTAARPVSAEPIGAPIGTSSLASLGWLSTDSPHAPAARSAPTLPVAPVGSLLSLVLSSFGWQVAELARPLRAQAASPGPTLSLGALAFGGAPWSSPDQSAQRRQPQRVAPVEPVGAFIPPPAPSTSVAWMSVAPIPPRPQVFSPMAVEIASVATYRGLYLPARGPIRVVSLTDEGPHVVVISLLDEGPHARVTSIEVEE